MRSTPSSPQVGWTRIFGRLRRMSDRAMDNLTFNHRSRDSSNLLEQNTESDMDQGVGPSDPQVYHSRPPTPRDPQPYREEPITPVVQTIQRIIGSLQPPEIQTAIDASPVDSVVPTLENSQPGISETVNDTTTYDYVPMRPCRPQQPLPSNLQENGGPTTGPSRPPQAVPSLGRSSGARNRVAWSYRLHNPSELRRAFIPQGSPPLEHPPAVPPQPYYRDYLDPRAAPAYRLVCHSVWYTQVGETLSLCHECVMAEHAYCTRQQTTHRLATPALHRT